jgi:hypothetical protein
MPSTGLGCALAHKIARRLLRKAAARLAAAGPQAAAFGVRKAGAGAWTARSRAAALLRVRQRARELGRRALDQEKRRGGTLGSENGRSGAPPGRGGACAVAVMTAKELARNVPVLL